MVSVGPAVRVGTLDGTTLGFLVGAMLYVGYLDGETVGDLLGLMVMVGVEVVGD